jgi:hypothetical protein
MELIQGFSHIVITVKGPLNQLRKEGEKQSKPEKVPFRRIFLSLNINEIRGCLQGIKGNTQGSKRP